LGKLKTFVDKQLANFKGDLGELKDELEPYKGKSFSEIKGMIQSEVSESMLKEYYEPTTTGHGMPSPDAWARKAREERYASAAAKYDKTFRGKILNICQSLFGYGALTTIITTIAGAYLTFSDKFDKIITPEMLGHGVIIAIIAGSLYLLSKLVYNITVPQEYVSKGTNADYSARQMRQP
jgi:hypothetical protein